MLSKAEERLSTRDIGGAARILSGEFRARLIDLVKSVYSKNSSLDLDRNAFLSFAGSVSSDLEALASAYPSYQNGIIRILPNSSLTLSGNQRFTASIIQDLQSQLAGLQAKLNRLKLALDKTKMAFRNPVELAVTVH